MQVTLDKFLKHFLFRIRTKISNVEKSRDCKEKGQQPVVALGLASTHTDVVPFFSIAMIDVQSRHINFDVFTTRSFEIFLPYTTSFFPHSLRSRILGTFRSKAASTPLTSHH
jgi:hypothetical protein